MKITLRFSSRLLPYVRNLEELQLTLTESVSVTWVEIFQRLFEYFPELKPVLIHSSGGLQPFIRVFLNGYDLNNRLLAESSLQAGDEIKFVAAVAGG